MMFWDRAAEVGGAALATFTLGSAAVETFTPQGAVSDPWFMQWWPLLSAVGVGFVMWGELRSRVKTLEQRTDALSKVPERLVAIETKLDLLLGTHPVLTRSQGEH
jgi:hypothetical protein